MATPRNATDHAAAKCDDNVVALRARVEQLADYLARHRPTLACLARRNRDYLGMETNLGKGFQNAGGLQALDVGIRDDECFACLRHAGNYILADLFGDT